MTPSGRERLVRLVLSGGTAQAVAEPMGVCLRTVCKWVTRFQAEGVAGLRDRSSRHHTLQRPTSAAAVDAIEALRRQRLTAQQIARDLSVSPATVSRVLRRLGLNRNAALEPPEPVRRYERERPGERIYIDIKKLGWFARTGHRITGDRAKQTTGRGERMGISVPGRRRSFPAGVLADPAQRDPRLLPDVPDRCPALLPPPWLTVERVMTDNGPAFKSRRYAKALRWLAIAHKRIRPYTPKTNGKVERFVQTSLREWAYARAYETSDQRRAALQTFLFRYNWQRPRMGINAKTPISRLNLSDDNLSALHS